MPKRRARLFKVIVQAVLLIDDGETLIEVNGPAKVVPASEWQSFVSGAFSDEDMAIILEQFDADQHPLQEQGNKKKSGPTKNT